MTKALFITHTAAPSGAELATLRLAIALRDNGSGDTGRRVDVSVACAQGGPVVDRMREAGLETIILPNTFDSRAVTVRSRSLRRLILGFFGLAKIGWSAGATARATGATVLVAESTKALVIGAVAARRAGIPLVWQVHDRISAEYFGGLLAGVVRGLGWVFSRGYIANSRSTMSTLFAWHRATLVAYPGVEPSRLADHVSQRRPSETVVVAVGRLTPWKGQDVFLRALADTTVRPQCVYLVGGTFFGEEAFRESLERLAHELDLPVIFTGHVDHPDAYMRHADILVHCSVIPEPFGQVVVEGMNAGCAVIASGPGGPTEIVESGINGLLVDGGDQEQLTAALNTLIGDRELRRCLSAAGRRRATHFDIAESARDIASFLDTVSATPERKRAAHG
ncbi:glycosyltransferase family 4 protein [Rhodococcus sp. JVH1]|uniref:glycosyltransferase family 4 protein n=1 Tax=Rhodococcus sp. JVH1 TaxID=745408 RepID=UPI0002D6846E|nr:glycosyltransferase family 4 protein [Rhodococcus sp. JVH1]